MTNPSMLVSWFAVLSLYACLSAGGAERGRLPAGAWGGSHIRLDVTEEGATVELDCAHGTIRGPILPGADGRFEAAGTYVQEHGGPEREGEEREGRPARYSGRVEGSTLTLTIALNGADETIGTFTLARGKAARLTKCL